VHPARLARGLAEVLERRGVHIFEATPVSQISSGRAVTPGGTVRATAIIRATEGYSATFAGLKRKVIPFYPLMIATEPLDAATLDEVGLRKGETSATYATSSYMGTEQQTDESPSVAGAPLITTGLRSNQSTT
jgi:glycine/D-amino acid oxidase-like deaminating enzyme